MAIDPATVAKVVEIGIKLYEFANKLKGGEKGDPLSGVVAQLEGMRGQISELGQTLHTALNEARDQILEDLRIAQLSKLPGAHASVVDYMRSHSPVPQQPIVNDPNYVAARNLTLEVVNYFNRPELAYMGGFAYAMNVRLEFITGLNPCWFQDSGFAGELRIGVDRLSRHIAHVKAGIDRSFVVRSQTKTVVTDPTTKPPLREPVSITFSVTGYSKTWPIDQAEQGRREANTERTRLSRAKQAEVMGHYDNMLAAWNSLLASVASSAVRSALVSQSRSAESAMIAEQPIEEPAELLASSLQPIEAQPAARALSDGESQYIEGAGHYAVPLRDMLVRVLQSPEFEQRQERALRVGDARIVAFWFRKAFHRDPSREEAASLGDVLKRYGPRSFFACLGYSREYEELWGSGLPLPEAELSPA